MQNPFVISLATTGFYPELFGAHTISSTIGAFLSIFSRAYINKKGFRVLQNPFVISLATTGFYPELLGTHTISSTIGAFLSIFSRAYINKKGFRVLQNPFVISLATTYSPTISSTIGADGFNFSVRNGKRWSPAAIVTLRF